ncbi:MAG: prepilin peptidase [Longimicrobiales bacterium]|nr:prepilin peptidase [Longimicrobiales bacterium]
MALDFLTASTALQGVLALMLALAVWFDVSERRIPNWLTVGGLVLSLSLRGWIGTEALAAGVLGAGSGLGLGFVLFAFGAMGAGDGKLMVAIGSSLGLEVFLRSLPLIAVFGGVLALAVTARRRTLIPTVLRCRELALHLVSFGRIGDRRTLSAADAVTIPYGVAMATGAAVACWSWGLSL